MLNALTIDVEDYFQVHAFSDVIHPENWDSFEPRVERNTYHLLDLLDSCHGPRTTDNGPSRTPRATFFILGWIAERYPLLVKEIHARGHEVACHGYAHKRIGSQTKEEFKEDVTRAKAILQDIIGSEVIGYRAPTYSVARETVWALEILFELGFHYDSSIFPVKHDYYGFHEAPRFPFYIDFSDGDLLSQFKNPKYLDVSRLKPLTSNLQRGEASRLQPPTSNLERGEASRLQPPTFNLKRAEGPSPHASCSMPKWFVEFPISTLTFFGRSMPFSGGGYFRLFPYRYSRWAFRKMNEQFGQAVIFYIHPWELDSKLPKVKAASLLPRLRTYVNLEKTEGKFSRLLGEFEFAPLTCILKRFGVRP